MQGTIVAAAFLILGVLGAPFGAVTALSDNLARSLVLRGRGGLHPFIGLLSVLGGLNLFGLVGVFLGPILAATLIALLDLWPIIADRAGVPLEKAAVSDGGASRSLRD